MPASRQSEPVGAAVGHAGEVCCGPFGIWALPPCIACFPPFVVAGSGASGLLQRNEGTRWCRGRPGAGHGLGVARGPGQRYHPQPYIEGKKSRRSILRRRPPAWFPGHVRTDPAGSEPVLPVVGGIVAMISSGIRAAGSPSPRAGGLDRPVRPFRLVPLIVLVMPERCPLGLTSRSPLPGRSANQSSSGWL